MAALGRGLIKTVLTPGTGDKKSHKSPRVVIPDMFIFFAGLRFNNILICADSKYSHLTMF